MTLRELLAAVEDVAQARGFLDKPVYTWEDPNIGNPNEAQPVKGFTLYAHQVSAIEQLSQIPRRIGETARIVPIDAVQIVLES